MVEYYDLEQLERRLGAAKSEIQQIRRKILIELIVTSVFLAYIWRFAFDLRSFLWFTIPLLINVLTWLFWIAVVAQRTFRNFSPELHEGKVFAPEQVSDEYRAHRFYLVRLTRLEAMFDVLTGIQFCAVSVCYLGTYLLGSW